MWRSFGKLPIYVAVLALAVGGCDPLNVDTFQGSWLALSLTWPLQAPADQGGQPVLLPPGEHLDLWAVFPNHRIVRVPANGYAPGDLDAFAGFNVVPATSPNDPCLIDQHGNHLLSAEAQPGPDAGSRQLQQMALVEKVREVVPTTTAITPAGGVMGKAPVPLLVLAEYDGVSGGDAMVLKGLGLTSAPGDVAARRAFCPGFIGQHPQYYQGDPRQLTAPLPGVQPGTTQGTLFGFFNFDTIGPQYQTQDPATFLPPQDFGGITITTRLSLAGVTGLLLTREATVNPHVPATNCAPQLGPCTVLAGVPLPAAAAGRGAIRFALVVTVTPPMGPPQMITAGTASVLTDLDQGLD